MTPSVIVPLFNGRDLIAACLASVPPDVEAIVVDDGSTDGAPDVVREQFPAVALLRTDRNRGFGGAANVGLRAASGDVRVVLNSDARLRPGALERLCRAFDEPTIGVAGGRRVFPDGTHQTSAARFPRLASIITGAFALNEVVSRLLPGRRMPWELGLARADHARSQDVDWVSGTCIAIRAELLDELGGFDEAYYMYGEETDLCWRAAQRGWRVRYVADAVVEHVGGGSTGDPAVHAKRFLRSELRFMRRAYGDAIAVRWRAARLAGSAIKIPAFALVSLVDRRARMRLRWHLAVVGALMGRGWRDALGDRPCE